MKVIELIHSYMIGSLPTTSYGNSKYFLTFINDFSRYYWVFFLKLRSEVYEILKDFKAFTENFSGKKIKVLRTHNGKECVNNKL